jgi:hypothetical protein
VCKGVRAPRKETDRRLVAVLREEVLSLAAIAKIRDQVRRLLSDLQRQASDASKAREARIRTLEGEIARLTDAVAQLGLSSALRARLVDAEGEYSELTARIESKAPALPSPEAIGAKIREVAVRLETALGHDMGAARATLSGKLGPVILEEKDGRCVGPDGDRPRTAARSRGRFRFYSWLRGPAILMSYGYESNSCESPACLHFAGITPRAIGA